MRAELVGITSPLGKLAQHCQTPEDILVYIARVSNPSNQENVSTGARLLKYCLDHQHWSVFEAVSATFEIQTSRAIAAQILRHRSFTFQEFSQRYSAVDTENPEMFQQVELRRKGSSTRQGSVEIDETDPLNWMTDPINNYLKQGAGLYKTLVDGGCAPESARFLLPLATTTTLYMTGSIRSWITYFIQRCDAHAQKEHRLLALDMRNQLSLILPTLAQALSWNSPS